jgi:hypothetical protein
MFYRLATKVIKTLGDFLAILVTVISVLAFVLPVMLFLLLLVIPAGLVFIGVAINEWAASRLDGRKFDFWRVT